VSKPPRTRTHATRPERGPARPVSKPHDRHEREAERAADVVARGGSVSSFSFSALTPSAPAVQRQDDGNPGSDDDKKKEALKKGGEAILESKPGKELKDRILSDPGVKKIKDAVTSPAGIAITGGLAAGGVAALGATHKALPFQPPAIPLDKITPGLSAQVKYEGALDRPTFVGLTLSYREQGPKKKEAKKDEIATDVARLRAQQDMFKPAAEKAAEQREADEFVQAYIRSQKFPALTVPLAGTEQEADVPKADEEKKKADEGRGVVQKAPASAGPEAAAPAEAYVEEALASPGRPLDAGTRRAMEARFGYDFSAVRIHDDARAAATAADLDAAAFTVGHDVVFGAGGRFDPASPEGRRLLAHELAHVVQQSRSTPAGRSMVQRRSIFETLGILLGLVEGTWEDRELQEYLDAVGRTGRIEGSYDSDNKARAIVRRWQARAPGFDLLARQKILLIREMLDGPTLGADEEAILTLLELSDASDLRAIFAAADGIALTALESDIDGENRRRLDTFVAHRFAGGRDAVVAGRIEVVGPTVPPAAPRFGFDPVTLEARFDSDRSAEDLIELIAAMPDADRTQALDHLVSVRRPRQLAVVDRLRRQLALERDAGRQRTLREATGDKIREQLKTERVLLHFYRGAVPATAGDLSAGTSATDPSRQAELREALRPPTRGPAGSHTFRDTLPGESRTYEQKVRDELAHLVQRHYDSLVAGHGPAEHADPARTHTLVEFETIGNAAKQETDNAFGAFYSAAAHPPLRADRPRRRGNVHDQFAETERALARMTPNQRRDMARALLAYFFQSDDWVRRLNHDHDAAPQFDSAGRPENDEARALDRVAADFVRSTANVSKLDEIERNWPAEARPETREIFFQVFREPTPERDRLLLWDVFQTFIHEYLHTLAHDRYRLFADTFGSNSNENNTLIEGVDSLLTEIVWSGIEPRVNDPALRAQVEGPATAAQPPVRVPHAGQQRYPSYTEALRLVDLVGIRNLYAAYFLGLVDRIGGTP
jgi:hypothetical protein